MLRETTETKRDETSLLLKTKRYLAFFPGSFIYDLNVDLGIKSAASTTSG